MFLRVIILNIIYNDTFIFGDLTDTVITNRGGVDKGEFVIKDKSGDVVQLPTKLTLKEMVSTADYHCRLVDIDNPLYDNKDNFQAKVYNITKKDGTTIIGHLLEVSGFKPGNNIVKFKSKVLEPWIVFQNDTENSSSAVKNHVALTKKNGGLLGEKDASANYNSKVLSKQALSKEAATEFVKNFIVSSSNNIVNDDVFDSMAKKAKEAADIKKSAFNIKDRSIIYRLSVNAAQINDKDGDFGVITVTDNLPADWELVPITNGKDYLIYKGKPATSITTIDATVLAEDSPVNLPSDKLEFVKTGNKLEFKFKKLDSPYVILFKLQLKEDKFKEYLNTKDKTVNNKAEINAEKKSYNGALNRWLTHTVDSSQEVLINEEFLTKAYDANANKQEEEGYLKWNIVYTPYKNYTDNTKVIFEDELGDNLSLRREKGSNNLVFQGDNYRIFEGTINADGIFKETEEITTGLESIFKYNKDTKKLTITLPNNNTTYKISYITDIVGDVNAGKDLGNKVYLREGNATEITTEVTKSYRATVTSSGKIKGFEKLTIIKTNANRDILLSGAEFKLTKEGTTQSFNKTTASNGKADFESLLAGTYILEETKAPQGYKETTTKYKIKITDLENGKKVELIDDAGNPVVKHGNATQSGNEITITNELKPENKTNLGKLKIVKKSEDGSKALFGAKFELYKGTNLITGEAKITDNNGIIEYDGLGAGDYILKETEAPVGYKKTVNEYGIKVTLAGTNVTVALDKAYADANMSAGELTVSNALEA